MEKWTMKWNDGFHSFSYFEKVNKVSLLCMFKI